MKKVLSWSFTGLFIILIFYGWYNKKMFYYLIAQAKGQYHLVTASKPIEKVLNDTSVSINIKEKILLISQVKHFTEKRLKLSKSDNYSTIFLHTESLMWVVTACPPFELKPYQWTFPFFGNFPYLGFFNKLMAIEEKEMLMSKGYDVGVRNPSAWSTLGWFKDPIFSGFLIKKKGELADLIIHELFHHTLYVKDSVQFNENLASFVGNKGAILFLKENNEDNELKTYQNDLDNYVIFKQYTLKKAEELNELYNDTNFKSLTIKEKQEIKSTFFINYIESICHIPNSDNWYRYFRRKKLNNTYFLSYLRYHNQEKILEKQLEEEFSNDLVQMINYYKERFAK